MRVCESREDGGRERGEWDGWILPGQALKG